MSERPCPKGLSVAVNSDSVDHPLRVVLVGAGDRGITYAEHALHCPDRMQIVAVCDPDFDCRNAAVERFGISSDMAFDSYRSLAENHKLADAAINCTMDGLHYESTKVLLEAGYDVLLEKPIAKEIQQVRELIELAKKHKRTIMICHVLRYAPFYQRIKKLLDDGQVGQIVSIHTSENVSFHHMATSFVRGYYNNDTYSSPIIIQKCCHDLDILAWFMSGEVPVRVASFGSLRHFCPDNAPAGSTERCLGGCKVEASCPYSARSLYVNLGVWPDYVWPKAKNLNVLSDKEKLECLKIDSPYGRCVWRCNNNVCDRQSLIVEFDNGTVASHDLFCSTARPTRKVHIVGTKGEIEGDLHDGEIILRYPKINLNADPLTQYVESIDKITASDDRSDSHGGGDMRLVEDFVSVCCGESVSRGLTRIEDSLVGHELAFAAELSRVENRLVTLD